MRSRTMGIALLALLLTLLPLSGVGESTSKTVDLMTPQHTDVGDVTVSSDGQQIVVTFTATGSWLLKETRLQVADSLAAIPQSADGNPLPEQFEFSVKHDLKSPVTVYTYPPIDVSGFKGTNLYIAAQANVVNITKGSMCVYSDNTLTFNGITSGKSGAAVVLTAVPPEWVSEVKHPFLDKKAKWVWESETVTHPEEGDIIEFYKTFTIPGLYPVELNNTKFFATCDNGYELYVNDHYVGRAQLEDGWRKSNLSELSVHAEGWQTPESYQVSDYLKCGVNTYRFATANARMAGGTSETNHGGLIFGSKIEYQSVDKEEAAWGEGLEFAGKTWSSYFEYPRPGAAQEPAVPGFEAGAALAGMLALAYPLVRRRY